MVLLRIEYKLDLVIRALQETGNMLLDLPDLRGIEGDTCPLCRAPIRLSINLTTESIERTCGCALNKKVVPGISTLLTSPEEAQDGPRSRDRHPEVPSDEGA